MKHIIVGFVVAVVMMFVMVWQYPDAPQWARGMYSNIVFFILASKGMTK